MYTRNKEVNLMRERSGLVSHSLLQRGDPGRSNPVVEAAAPRSRFGAGLRDHRRNGQDAGERVGAGGRCGRPSLHPFRCRPRHRECFGEVLIHFSAATPTLDAEVGYDTGQLRSEG